MIYRFRKKYISIMAVTVTIVVLIIFFTICGLSSYQLNTAMDVLNDGLIFRENGKTSSSIRFFVVYFDGQKNITKADIEYVSAITESDAAEYAKSALASGEERGWVEHYRYKVYETKDGVAVSLVDGSMNRTIFKMIMTISATVLVFSALFIVVFLVFYSKREAVLIEESYEKQKQFMTDVNHELKTPLALIMTNVDIVEQELGQNEWLDDIRSEGQRMSGLINQLITLSKMDEENSKIDYSEFDISNAILDTSSEFSAYAEKYGVHLVTDIETGVMYMGDESLIRRLVTILIDNALKYCDKDGVVSINLSAQKWTTLTVENTYTDVNNVDFDRIFYRFYRADSSRSKSGSYGIGLSIAKGIAEKHNGSISAYKKDSSTIGFKVVLKSKYKCASK